MHRVQLETNSYHSPYEKMGDVCQDNLFEDGDHRKDNNELDLRMMNHYQIFQSRGHVATAVWPVGPATKCDVLQGPMTQPVSRPPRPQSVQDRSHHPPSRQRYQVALQLQQQPPKLRKTILQIHSNHATLLDCHSMHRKARNPHAKKRIGVLNSHLNATCHCHPIARPTRFVKPMKH